MLRIKNRQNTLTQFKTASGFTLLEVMVALAMFAVISVAAFTSLTQVQKAHDFSNEKMDNMTQLQLAIRKLEQDLSQITLRPIRNESDETIPALKTFSQDNFYLEFTRSGTDESISLNKTKLLRVAYYIKDKKLYRKIWYQLDRSSDEKAEAYVILNKINSAKIEYFDDKNQSKTAWSSETGGGQTLPMAIKISFDLEGLGKLERLFEMRGVN